MQSSRRVWRSSLFFISSNLIAIFQSRMTWWKWLRQISIVWISVYVLLAKHSSSFICDLSIRVYPALYLLHAKGNIMRETNRVSSLLHLFFLSLLHLYAHLYHGNLEQRLLATRTVAFAESPNILDEDKLCLAVQSWASQYRDYNCTLLLYFCYILL